MRHLASILKLAVLLFSFFLFSFLRSTPSRRPTCLIKEECFVSIKKILPRFLRRRDFHANKNYLGNYYFLRLIVLIEFILFSKDLSENFFDRKRIRYNMQNSFFIVQLYNNSFVSFPSICFHFL